jgi:Protein of unknown function (DUF2630)
VEDRTIRQHISELVDEEHRLRAAVQQGRLDTGAEHTRLAEVEAELDQCWDLLRRRRAAREFHGDPDRVTPRPIDEVEHYQQ